jgi:iron(III) transport system ATP-binding protein
MIRIEGLTKSFRSAREVVVALSHFDLEVDDGELVVLLGPSGCGKTTALRCIAGLESADEGRIQFDEQVVYDSAQRIDVPPRNRNLGMVFQSYALWPHKTVEANIAYPLKVRKMKEELRQGWVQDVAKLVSCSGLLDRYPSQLSGGQQQRIALARALVARPAFLLFDEPLSNLDALLRTQVRSELHELHRRLGFSGLYVTHDQDEAYAIGDRLVIMRAGAIEHIDTPTEVYGRPATAAAAEFVGFSNVVHITRAHGGLVATGSNGTAEQEGAMTVRFRPSDLEVRPPDAHVAGGVALRASVVDLVFAGSQRQVTLDSNGTRILGLVGDVVEPWLEVGGTVTAFVPLDRCRFFDEQGRAIAAPPSSALQAVGGGVHS